MLANVENFTKELEGGFANINGDRGGVTFRGISSRIYPELTSQIMDGTLSDKQVNELLTNDYYFPIVGMSWLEQNAPDLAWLLYIGRVHGSGDDHLTMLIQETLNSLGANLRVDGIWGKQTFVSVKTLWPKYSKLIRQRIDSSVERLAERRAESVGVDSIKLSIKRRVMREHEIAILYRIGEEASLAIDLVQENDIKRIQVNGIELLIRRI